MFKNSLIYAAAVLLSFQTMAQDSLRAKLKPKPNTIYLEIAGTCGSPLSFNFEQLLNEKKENPNNWIGIRTGITYGPLLSRIVVPVIFSVTTNPQRSSHFEGGIGIVGEFSKENEYNVSGYYGSPFRFALGAVLMYKYQKKHNGFCFRIGFTPCLYDDFLFFNPPADPLSGHVSADFLTGYRFFYLLMPGISFGNSF